MRGKGFLSVMLYAAALLLPLCALSGCQHSSGGGGSVIVWTGNAPDGRFVMLTVTKAAAAEAQTSADGGQAFAYLPVTGDYYTLKVDGKLVGEGTVRLVSTSMTFYVGGDTSNYFYATLKASDGGATLTFSTGIKTNDGGKVSVGSLHTTTPPLKPYTTPTWPGSLITRTYSISLSESGTYNFGEDFSDVPMPPLTVSVTNTGNTATGQLTVALSGDNSFTLSKTTIGSIARGGTAYFTVEPKLDLEDDRTYTAKVTVNGGNGISAGFDVRFTVLNTYGISMDESPAAFDTRTVSYTPMGALLTHIRNNGVRPTGPLTARLVFDSNNPSSSPHPFTLSETSDTVYETTTIEPIDEAGGWSSVSVWVVPGLGAGTKDTTYKASVTVSGGHGIFAQRELSFTVRPATPYDSVAAALAYLNTPTAGYSNPVPLKLVGVNLSDATTPAESDPPKGGWQALMYGLANQSGEPKNVALYLSECTVDSNVFNPSLGNTEGKKKVVSLILPDTATSITSTTPPPSSAENSAFKDFENLSNVSGLSITHIPAYAFYGRNNLTTARFPAAISIGDYAFKGCGNLATADIHKANSIGTYAFHECYALTAAAFPDVEGTAIGANAFENCSKLTTAAFQKAKFIGANAFRNCTSLKTATFTEAETIGQEAFRGCTALETVIFQKATTIGTNAFTDCPALKTATFKVATAIDKWFFSGATKLESIDCPNVQIIANNAFEWYSYLKTANFQGAKTIGTAAFSNCTSLTTANFPNAETIGSTAFLNCKSLTTAIFPKAKTIGDLAFKDCTSLTTANFPEATNIGDHAFDGCTKLPTANFPKAIHIGNNAFYGCTKLQSASFPLATTIISTTAFSGCTALEFVNFQSAPEIWRDAFNGCTKLMSADFQSATHIGDRAFANTGSTSLTIRLGSTAPYLDTGIFSGATAGKYVTVRVPNGAGGPSGTYNDTWKNNFKGSSGIILEISDN